MSFWSPKVSGTERPTPDMEKILERALPGALRFPQFYVMPNVRIHGDLEATSHGHVDGTVDGRITLADHTLTIGREGRVHGDVLAGTVVVRGTLSGDVTASEGVEIAAGATVCGSITAPRVVLAEGARFSGRVNETSRVEPDAVPVKSPWRPAVRARPWLATASPLPASR